jgi:hypothetical protein
MKLRLKSFITHLSDGPLVIGIALNKKQKTACGRAYCAGEHRFCSPLNDGSLFVHLTDRAMEMEPDVHRNVVRRYQFPKVKRLEPERVVAETSVRTGHPSEGRSVAHAAARERVASAAERAAIVRA